MPVPRIYGDSDPRDLPLYGQREAARFIGVGRSTLRGWVGGIARGSAPAVLRPPSSDGRLSFNNLVEGYILRSLTQKHDVTLDAVRRAVRYAETELGVSRLLLRRELRWSGDLFWDQLSELINLSQSGQLALKDVMASYLERVDWDDESNLPRRLFPRVESDPIAKSVVIDPRVAFGSPTVSGTGVPTSVVAGRIDAGESVGDVAHDYGAEPEAIRNAVVYERAA